MSKLLTSCTTDHLFLLIGTNPLPNYVTAKLLAGPKTHVYLVHSDETGDLANRLVSTLKLPEGKWSKVSVKEADPCSIYSEVSKYARDKSVIGLNYTGGTKLMAVHAFQAVRDADPDAIFSYLDAWELKMIAGRSGAYPVEITANNKVNINFKELLSLHGLTLDENEFSKELKYPHLCKAIADLNKNEKSLSVWKRWVNKNQCKDLPLQVDELDGVIQAMREICDGLEFNGDNLARFLGYERGLSSSQIWFQGKWLENHVLNIIIQLVNRNDITNVSDYGMNLRCKKDSKQKDSSFELDVALILGYQLFAISCIVSDDKAKCKEHLFEAYVRAKQMGGDEAKVGLVCNYDRPELLQQEVEESWDVPKKKIRVFGSKHWPALTEYLMDWFNS
ncbi:DUF1887 family protein [Desulfotomaculum copahuensis]|uniref:Card1 CARF domain-containing protein n=1 Tax=Desulfotomaculum copahuensis TaxID=1838280 RepID=A0A1B7LJT9_9FIRM|nr:DUF1887 family protein [Desulfotomaculum copahuensis]OAT86751.1 hypothetical protein A6M21_02750 [Desulfotomaculum copahuensis]